MTKEQELAVAAQINEYQNILRAMQARSSELAGALAIANSRIQELEQEKDAQRTLNKDALV